MTQSTTLTSIDGILSLPDTPYDIGPLGLQRGRISELVGPAGMGLTRIGLGMLVETSRRAPVVLVDVRGWASPGAAWEAGIDPDRLVVVRCPETASWSSVTAALVGGVGALFAEVPAGVGSAGLRRLAAMARARGSGVVLRPLTGELPGGVSHTRIKGMGVTWEGPHQGHGRLMRRRLIIEVSGRGVGGMTRRFELEDDGEDRLSVVPVLATGSTRRTDVG